MTPILIRPSHKRVLVPIRSDRRWRSLYACRLRWYRIKAERMKQLNYERWARFVIVDDIPVSVAA